MPHILNFIDLLNSSYEKCETSEYIRYYLSTTKELEDYPQLIEIANSTFMSSRLDKYFQFKKETQITSFDTYENYEKELMIEDMLKTSQQSCLTDKDRLDKVLRILKNNLDPNCPIELSELHNSAEKIYAIFNSNKNTVKTFDLKLGIKVIDVTTRCLVNPQNKKNNTDLQELMPSISNTSLDKIYLVSKLQIFLQALRDLGKFLGGVFGVSTTPEPYQPKERILETKNALFTFFQSAKKYDTAHPSQGPSKNLKSLK